ncbi:MAG: 1-(5-phosphoribosyl)-5-((5-phosphoribosylamino)methylideneamino)imidazole-4-carboxamide isomerase, partial [Candidatus Omnitrophica bacterium]|nr:1-(5-phosphoribosyl)-5-((5-phosphoribosylamino)methylideneamino)imidazole-4-carboxamide isomerase [Candidatus Omnitrophota bacterium]
IGAETIIYTDISTDGTLKGPNIQAIRAMAQAIKIGLIASGGVSKAADLEAIRGLGLKNISGVIIGKALYEGRLTLKEAIRACSSKE